MGSECSDFRLFESIWKDTLYQTHMKTRIENALMNFCLGVNTAKKFQKSTKIDLFAWILQKTHAYHILIVNFNFFLSHDNFWSSYKAIEMLISISII